MADKARPNEGSKQSGRTKYKIALLKYFKEISPIISTSDIKRNGFTLANGNHYAPLTPSQSITDLREDGHAIKIEYRLPRYYQYLGHFDDLTTAQQEKAINKGWVYPSRSKLTCSTCGTISRKRIITKPKEGN